MPIRLRLPARLAGGCRQGPESPRRQGGNVSMPYKTDIIPLLDEISEVPACARASTPSSTGTVSFLRHRHRRQPAICPRWPIRALTSREEDDRPRLRRRSHRHLQSRYGAGRRKEISIFNAQRLLLPPGGGERRQDQCQHGLRGSRLSAGGHRASARRSRPAPCWPQRHQRGHGCFRRASA